MADSLLINGTIELLGGGVPSTLPQCTGAVFRLAPGYDLSAPQPLTNEVISLLLDGSRPVGDRSDNRPVGLPVVILAPDRDILAAAVEALLQAIDQEQWSMTWTRDGGLPAVFDCFRARAASVNYNLLRQKASMPCQALKISFPALPYLHADTPVTLTFDSPFSGTLAPPSSVELDNYSSVAVAGWSQSTQHVLDTYSAYWPQQNGGFPVYAKSFPPADISALSALTWWFGLGTGWQDYWEWNRGPVTFSITLTDQDGDTVTFGTTQRCASSNNQAAPNWQQITVPLPFDDSFNFGAVVGYQLSCWSAAGWYYGQIMQASVYLNGFTAAPGSASTPASTRGWLASLYGIQGSAHAPLAVQFQLLELGTTVQTFTTPGAFNVTFPGGVTSSRVQEWGPGGPGAEMTTAGEGGAGSGGGYGEEPDYPVSGTMSGVIGSPSNNTTFDSGGAAGGVLATAGTAATTNSSAGAVATDTSTNTIHHPGGDGADGSASGGGDPDVVQSKQFTFTGSSGSGALGSATGEGNCLVVLVSVFGSTSDPTIEAVTIGGSADNFAQAADAIAGASPPGCYAWLDEGCAGGQTEIAVELSGGEGSLGATVTVLEVQNVAVLGALDQGHPGDSGSESSSFTSGDTAETTQAEEIWVGMAATLGYFGTPTLTGPGSGWTNLSEQSFSIDSQTAASVAGYKVVSTEGTAVYSGTISGYNFGFNALVIALKGAPASTGGGGGSSAGTGSAGNPGDGPIGGAAPTGGAAGGNGAEAGGAGGAGAAPGGGGGGALSTGSTEAGGAGGNGKAIFTYQGTVLSAFSTLIAHIPGPDAPATLVPYVSVGNGSDTPNGGTEYLIASAANGVNARFGGTYSILIVAETLNDPSLSRTITVTVNEHEYSGGTNTATPVARTLIPDTTGASDLTSGLNGIICLGEVTLPTRDIAPDNTESYFGVTVTSTDTSDRYLDVLFIDTAGQLALVNLYDQTYTTFYLDVPDQTVALGRVLASQGDRNQAASVLANAQVSGGPLYVNPGDNTMLVYSPSGAPSMVATYRPAFRIDRTS